MGKLEENGTAVLEDKKQLVQVIEIDHTPFVAVKNEDNWFVGLGKYKLSGHLKSHEECIEFTKDTSWSMLFDVLQ